MGAEVAEALAAATSAPAGSDGDAIPTGHRCRRPGVPAVPVQDGRLRRRIPRVGEITPVELRLPSLGVGTRVRRSGWSAAASWRSPRTSGRSAGTGSVRGPADRQGSVVMSGHIDSAEQGKGAFFRLRELRPGDTVLVRLSSGRSWRYRVVAREVWPKTVVPLDRIFSRSGAPRLTLVTCGGGFREDVGSYQDNIAVTAVPVAMS